MIGSTHIGALRWLAVGALFRKIGAVIVAPFAVARRDR